MKRDIRLVPCAFLIWILCFSAFKIPYETLISETATTWLKMHGTSALTMLSLVVLGFIGVFLYKRFRNAVGVDAPQSPNLTQSEEVTTVRGAASLRVTVLWSLIVVLVVLIRVILLHYSIYESGIPNAATQNLFVSGTARVVSEPKKLNSPRSDQEEYWYSVRVEQLTINGQSTTHPAQLRIVVPGPVQSGPAFGSMVQLQGTLSQPENGTRTLATLRARGAFDVVSDPEIVNQATNHLRARLNEIVANMSPQARGLVPGAAVGDTRQLSPELSEEMKVSGLTHITAVSGSHFAIIFLLIQWATARLQVGVRASLIALTCVAFVLLVHPSGSVLRALTMGLVAVFAVTRRRRSQGLAALAVASIVLLVFDPFQASDYGFLLSVLATSGLIVGSGPIARFLHRPRMDYVLLPQHVSQLIAVPLAAQLAVGPVLLFLQPYISLYSVPANILAAPALAPATIFGLLATLLSPLSGQISSFFAHVAGMATWWIATVASLSARLPGAKIPWWEGTPGFAVLSLGTVILWCLAWGLRAGQHRQLLMRFQQMVFVVKLHFQTISGTAPKRMLYPSPDKSVRFDRGWKEPVRYRLAQTPLVRALAASRKELRRGTIVAVALLGVTLAFLVQPIWLRAAVGINSGNGNEQWLVWACDVSQGDGFLTRGRDHQIYMMDVGQDPHLVLDCLAKAGVKKIDVLFISHYHADHYGALEAVLESVTVNEIVTGPIVERNAGTERVFAAAQAHGVSIYAIGSSQTETRFGVGARLPDLLQQSANEDSSAAWSLAWPTSDELALLAKNSDLGADQTNNLSMVVAVELFGGYRAIFLGDLEEEGQSRFARYLQQNGGSRSFEIVKMAHHGSASQSSDLARILDPEITLIGVGVDNGYGHPSPRALSLYEDLGSIVLRTDECGSFGIYTNAERWFVVGGCP